MNAGALRRFWVATHRYLGLTTLVFLFVAAVTGCLLCVRGPLDAALNPDLFNRSTAAGQVDAVQAVAALEARRPELRARSFFLNAPGGGNLTVTVAAADPRRPLAYDQVFLDGGDGHMVGARKIEPGLDARHFVQGVYVLHYTLLAGTCGRWLMGVAALGWLIGALIGLYLTFPARAPVLRGWMKAWLVNPASRIGRLLLDLHQASGLWLLIGVIVLAFTSVGMNFFDEAVVPAAQALSPAKPSPFDGPAPKAPGPQRLTFAEALAAGKARAAARGLAWRPAQLDYIAERNLYSVSFTRTGVVRYEGLGPVAYLFDAATGRFVYEDNPYEDSAGRAVSRSLYPLHTGEVFGAVGMVFIFLAGLSTVEMCVTGGVVWWMRRGGRVMAKKAKRQAVLAARKAPA